LEKSEEESRHLWDSDAPKQPACLGTDGVAPISDKSHDNDHVVEGFHDPLLDESPSSTSTPI
jgi:hypothetical protein